MNTVDNIHEIKYRNAYLARLSYKPWHIDVDIYEDNGGGYSCSDSNGDISWIEEDPAKASVICHGFLKLNGCCEWYFPSYGEQDASVHFCGFDTPLFDFLKELSEHAEKHFGDGNGDPAR